MKEYRTDNLALCPYLHLQGMKYIRSEVGIGKGDKPVVQFVFEDPQGLGRDFELDFMRSNEKKYRDMLFFFRNEIEKLKRKVDKVNRDESRKSDDKYYGERTGEMK